MKQKILQMTFAVLLCASANAQVNSGSNGSDGAFNPTTNTVINMADHPTGIYQYTSVNISNGVTVTFIPNANNSPVTWLVQSNVVINGTVDVSGQSGNGSSGGQGGLGGWQGGNGGSVPTSGQGPGGGFPASVWGGNGSFANLGGRYYGWSTQGEPGATYGNNFLIPLIGGSGAGGGNGGGAGGGGAVLIAATSIQITGLIKSEGGPNSGNNGVGSGGAIRLYAAIISGSGTVDASGGNWNSSYGIFGGAGRVRFDTYQNNFSGSITGVFTTGFQPIIIPTAGQGAQLTVMSVGGVAVSASPTGALSTPDAVLSAQQNNPVPVVVSCANLPLNTQITVSVKAANGATVTATGYNTTGTLAASTAAISIVMPRGGGLIYATAATSN
jgi:hypothetical protein